MLKVKFCFALIVTLIIMHFSLPSPAYAAEPAIVLSTIPATEQQQVDPESVIKVTFDQAMNSATLNPINIILEDSTQRTVSLLSIQYDPANNTALITPAVPLKLSTVYRVVITTGVQDSSNTPIAQAYTWSFTTAAISTHPASGQSQVDPESAIFVTFDQAMNPLTFDPTTCILKENSIPQKIVSLLSIHYDATNNTAVLVPTVPLKLTTDYQVVITTGVQNSNKTPLAQDYTWSFQTANSPQPLVPAVVFTTPLTGDSMVGLSQPIQASFNRGMDASTINNYTFLIKDSVGGAVAAQSITYDVLTRTATFIPTNLEPNKTYLVTIKKNYSVGELVYGVKDSVGISLAQDFNGTFTTGTTPYYSPHGNYITNSAACKSCHQTHTAEGKGLLTKSTQTQVCYTCHDGSGSSTNLKEKMNPSIETLSETQSYHPIMDTGNANVIGTLQCTDCHNPHGDKDEQGNYYPNLLRATSETTTAYQGEAFCSVCHNSNTVDKAYNPLIHTTQLNCSSCHASHSSANPSLNVQPTNTQTCLSCHPTVQTSGTSGFSNELQSNLHSNVNHLDCSECHSFHGELREGLLIGDGNPITSIHSDTGTNLWYHDSCATVTVCHGTGSGA